MFDNVLVQTSISMAEVHANTCGTMYVWYIHYRVFYCFMCNNMQKNIRMRLLVLCIVSVFNYEGES